MKPRLLDLFCGAGGAARGYQMAGFHVTGIDVKPQPRYAGDLFIQGDALNPPVRLEDFDVVHASPPCQRYAAVTRWQRGSWAGDPTGHPDLVPRTRDMLTAWGGSWVIENVREAQLRAPMVLCGSAFGLTVKRHRYFESNALSFGLTTSCNHSGLLPFMHKGERAYADAMGCTWMTSKEAREAIPPAYTQFIGEQLMEHLQREAS